MADNTEMDNDTATESRIGAHLKISLAPEVKTNVGFNVLNTVKGRKWLEKDKAVSNSR